MLTKENTRPERPVNARKRRCAGVVLTVSNRSQITSPGAKLDFSGAIAPWALNWWSQQDGRDT